VDVLEVVQRRRAGGNNFNLQVHFAKFEAAEQRTQNDTNEANSAACIEGCAYYSPVTGLIGRIIMAHITITY
jgi:hypothetical protein